MCFIEHIPKKGPGQWIRYTKNGDILDILSHPANTRRTVKYLTNKYLTKYVQIVETILKNEKIDYVRFDTM